LGDRAQAVHADLTGASRAPGRSIAHRSRTRNESASAAVYRRFKAPVSDGTAYNHYSLLGSMEAAFGLAPLAHAGDPVVPQMVPLFRP
jgi:hypothetical protein